MHYLLGLAALVMGAVIATRRTRPTWFVVLTSVLVGLGALLAILSYTRVTDSLGLVTNNVIGWTFVGLSIITMLSAIFVLERRGEQGEELPPLIGDNPFDGDTDDADDPAIGAIRATSQDGVLGSDADVMAGDAAGPVVSGYAAHPADARASVPSGRTATAQHMEGSMTDSTTPNASQGDADAEARADGTASSSRPGPSEGAQDGTAVVGADPDIATPPAETDVDAAPEGDVGTHDPDGTARA
jgi:hypothetical protein